MRTSKFFLFAAAIVLLAGMGAMAQGKLDSINSASLPPEPFQDIVRVNAVEVSDGIIGIDNQTKKETVFGYSFLGRTTGSMPGSFTLSMNCAPALPLPGETSELTGGSWTLPVYITEARGGYVGSVYGIIANGSVNWDKTGTSATVYAVLNVDGGTQIWDGAQGFATFVGTIFIDEKTQKTTLSGDLVFTIIGPGKE